MAAPKLTAAAREAESAPRAVAENPAAGAVAREVRAVGGHGRPLGAGEREALVRRLGREGDAALLNRQLAAMAQTDDVELHDGNRARLLVDGPATFEAMFGAIAGAQRRVLIESYIVDDAAIARRLADLLVDRRRHGVQVALLYDDIGSFGTDAGYFERLQAAGVEVCAFNPLKPGKRATGQSPTHRDHRKIVVVDRRIAYTGGINISAVYGSGSSRAARPSGGFGSGGPASPAPRARDGADVGWRDTHVQLAGPVAAALDDLVLDTWRSQRCGSELAPPARTPAAPPTAGDDVVRIVSASPDDTSSRIYALLMTSIAAAQRSIHLTMAYFAPGDEMVDALCRAAQRGVDVQLVLPSRSDFTPVLHAGRSHYARLLAAGVRLHELQGSVLHAKTGVVDGVLSTVGSSNLDYRSFDGNNEINAVVLGRDFGGAMERLFEQDVAASREITRRDWADRTLVQRLKEAGAAWLERWW